jgi:bifunctional non-homologous end joining protein LigD
VAQRASSGQLTLDIAAPAPTGGLPAIAPMSPLVGGVPFDDEAWFFEPWWPGTQALMYVDGRRVHLDIEHLADPNPAFAELAGSARQFAADRVIVHGSLLILGDGGRPDADLLRRRLAGERGASGLGTAALVASDLLYVGRRALLQRPFADRRAQLIELLRDGDRLVVARGLRGEGTTLAAAAAAMGMSDISARRLTAPYRPGTSDDDWRRLSISETPAAPARPFLALLQRLPL